MVIHMNFLSLLDASCHRHALRGCEEPQDHVDLFLLDQTHGFVDRHIGLALSVGIDRLDLVALDATLLDKVVDHDLGAQIMQL